MTGKERLEAVLHKRKPDRLPWATLVDGATLGALPPGWQGISGLDFYRRVGADIVLLNGWGTDVGFASPEFRWGPDVTEQGEQHGDRQLRHRRCPSGTLTAAYHGGHPVEYPVRTPQDLRVYRAMWEDAGFHERDDTAAARKIEALVGDDGVVTRFWGPSTIPRLLEYEMGTENFYYLLHDEPAAMEDLIATIHRKELRAFEALARGPVDVLILCENTSTYYISPEVYRRYNGRHVRDFVDIAHAAGKVAIVHMCGHIRNLLGDIRQTGLDGVHFLTPPPVGDTPWELYLDEVGEDQIIIGALPANVFVQEPLDRIAPALDAMCTPRLRRSNFILHPTADGIVVSLDRFQAVGDWARRQ